MVNGLWNSVAGKVLHKFRACGIKLQVIGDYVRSFSWPQGISATVNAIDVFSDGRLKNSLAAKKS